MRRMRPFPPQERRLWLRAVSVPHRLLVSTRNVMPSETKFLYSLRQSGAIPCKTARQLSCPATVILVHSWVYTGRALAWHLVLSQCRSDSSTAEGGAR